MTYGIILALRQTSKVEPQVYKQATVASLRRAMDIPEQGGNSGPHNTYFVGAQKCHIWGKPYQAILQIIVDQFVSSTCGKSTCFEGILAD